MQLRLLSRKTVYWNKGYHILPMNTTTSGTIAELWRYPVKSMQGERLTAAPSGIRGLVGDRAYAIVDRANGTIASAKHPRKWGVLLACQATYVEPPEAGHPLPPIVIALPDGSRIRSDDHNVDAILSRLFQRDVTLTSDVPAERFREFDRTPLDQPDAEPVIRREPFNSRALAGAFFDYGAVHILSTATLAFFQKLHPNGQFAIARFRPNLVLDFGDTPAACIEHAWLGQDLSCGADVLLNAMDPCPRCVVTTAAQGDLPRDPAILRTITAHSSAASINLAPGAILPAVAGIYANVVRTGIIRQGDRLRVFATSAGDH
jgi:uncharacterized protein